MLQEILDAIKRREKEAEIGGRKVVVRERAASQSLGIEAADNQTVMYWKLVINCVFDAETKEPVFTTDDLPQLMDGAQRALQSILSAVDEVNGLNVVHEEKN